MSVVKQAFIGQGQNLSAAVDMRGYDLVGIEMPDRFTGTTLSFQVADDNGSTFEELTDNTGTAITVTVAAGKMSTVSNIKGFGSIKVRSGLVGAPTAQGNDAPIRLILEAEAV